MSQVQYQAEMTETPVLRFAGHNFEPLPSGALYWHSRQTLLVADLHLEKMSSFARRGQMLPPYDTGMTLSRLEADLRRTGAQRLVSLGDSFHRDEGTTTLSETDRARLDRLTGLAEWLWLAGNHDPRPHVLGGQCRNEVTLDGLVLTHEPRRGTVGLMAGHLHPAAHIQIEGRSTRRPCFVHDNRLMILPAYGASTGSINILSAAFNGLFHLPGLEVTMLGKDRTYPVSPKRLVRN
ncbi:MULTISPECIES: ligase-associated DNA damage response endonuclease PdeM [Devosia]|uniref:Ligase-associated DNA damage response endonuclease PdeM n=1 Tax=Devosia litorisediminis TaxID=2829817 RepID=A0A942E7H6_9HYPH|nr:MULTISPECIES: ligase-associated DNA damage response endonuclease PdeM [Devosia]MBS3849528.1 ligase-associated DNA damage response endonuclease PdeM [Devosia litorisediminis]MCZ4344457.1 ligase-associated DNA damage response endonuclease PdeM [Devosia neptuniae]